MNKQLSLKERLLEMEQLIRDYRPGMAEDDDSLHSLAHELEGKFSNWCRCGADMLCPVCRQTILRAMGDE